MLKLEPDEMEASVTYTEYYARCRAIYEQNDPGTTVYNLLVHPHYVDSPQGCDILTVSQEFRAAVADLADEMGSRLTDPDNLYVEANPAARQIALQLDNFWGILGIETLASMLVPQIEQRVFGCYAVVNQINILRTLSTTAPLTSSWLWHYDNNPAESLKVLIYLNDVGVNNGPFEYLRNKSTGEAVRVESSRLGLGHETVPKWKGSRVPLSYIEQSLAGGYEAYKVIGRQGTFILFDNNCIHRATVPAEGHRDAMILHVRPCHERVRPFISPSRTGSWGYNAKRWNPYDLSVAAG